MAAPTVQLSHVAASATRAPHAVCWGRNGLVSFGSANSVVLYVPQKENSAGFVYSTLNEHTQRVNCVHWIQKNDLSPETELLSGGSDHIAILWVKQNSQFKCSEKLQGHKGAVTAVDGRSLASRQDEPDVVMLVTSAADSTVRIWLRHVTEDDVAASKVECVQELSFGTGFAMDISLAELPGSKEPILACGGDGCKSQLYTQQYGQFVQQQLLVGHEDWIQGLEFVQEDGGDLLLASCSQDCMIRLWRVSPKSPGEELAFPRQEEGVLKLKENTFSVLTSDQTFLYYVKLEAVLAGHENRVYGVHWQPASIQDGKHSQPMNLLSASMDKTMIIWSPDEETGVWLEKVRVGEVGGNTLGFLGCQFSAEGTAIIAHAFHGALHLWHSDCQQKEEWRPGVVISGHFGPVQDLCWEPEKGGYILSVSSDQTTRLFAPWKRDRCQVTWHEVARPQIHGYDMQCLAPLGKHRFISGADEKVLRVFSAPRSFLHNLASISGHQAQELPTAAGVSSDLPEGASVPALGLSNKAVYQADIVTCRGEPNDDREIEVSANEQYQEMYFQAVALQEPPMEDHLLQNTLWPEVQKLYGHGYEVFSVAAHPAGSLVASSCKASKPEHAAILLWDAGTWCVVGILSYHGLTVTQLAFSPDGSCLLAVSRDRTWSLWRHRDASQPQTDDASLYRLLASTDKKTAVHTRVIWACDWSHDGKYFTTTSRDKKVVVWGKQENAFPTGAMGPICQCSSVLDATDSATAVAFAPREACDGRYLMAVGLESGKISLYLWNASADSAVLRDWTPWASFSKNMSHTLTVKRLRWRPRVGRAGSDTDDVEDDAWLQLASAGADSAVRIFDVYVPRHYI
ncbi:elongator complex protein 2 isoform X1 [Lethenteron reissneri]|uniref:elongator complex protein 2 isoform X1 n=1 Tax=Lethenteron reissneri TaxID=7753 RepID=UPI002AB74CCB|nr:elongator complex protein 2 isoform X1 [Lethenteron reissneri]